MVPRRVLRRPSVLPRGVVLDERTWRYRHRVLLAVLGLHLPTYLLIALALDAPAWRIASWLGPLGFLAVVAAVPVLGRMSRSLALALGYALSSGILVHMAGGLPEAHLHHILVLGLVALYQDWRPFLLVAGGLVAHLGILGVVAPESVFIQAYAIEHAWAWVLIRVAFVLAASALLLTFWKLAERELEHSEQLWKELHVGEDGLVQRLRAADALKAELIAVVSHEFRTPLTAIIGYSQLVSSRLEDLDPAEIRAHLRTIDEQAGRLTRIVQNVVAASDAAPIHGAASTDLAIMAAHLVHEIAGLHEGQVDFHVELPSALPAAVHDEAAHRVLGNLLDNAAKFAAPGTEVEVRGAVEHERVILAITNVAALPPGRLERLFEPFVQGDSSDTRLAPGVGLGLSVAKKLVEAYDGCLDLSEAEGRVVTRVAFPRAVGGTTIDLTQDSELSRSRAG